MLIRAFEGRDIKPDSDPITRLINVKNILERSNFPSMSIINFQVYARLVAYYHPIECKAFSTWANLQAESLKSYKALSSEQYVEMFKAQNAVLPQTSSTNISFGQKMANEEKKKSWFNRRKKDTDNETIGDYQS